LFMRTVVLYLGSNYSGRVDEARHEFLAPLPLRSKKNFDDSKRTFLEEV
jgi:hypothetical protein